MGIPVHVNESCIRKNLHQRANPVGGKMGLGENLGLSCVIDVPLKALLQKVCRSDSPVPGLQIMEPDLPVILIRKPQDGFNDDKLRIPVMDKQHLFLFHLVNGDPVAGGFRDDLCDIFSNQVSYQRP